MLFNSQGIFTGIVGLVKNGKAVPFFVPSTALHAYDKMIVPVACLSKCSCLHGCCPLMRTTFVTLCVLLRLCSFQFGFVCIEEPEDGLYATVGLQSPGHAVSLKMKARHVF